MTSTASLASKNEKKYALYMLSDFPGIMNLSGLNDLLILNNIQDQVQDPDQYLDQDPNQDPIHDLFTK